MAGERLSNGRILQPGATPLGVATRGEIGLFGEKWYDNNGDRVDSPQWRNTPKTHARKTRKMGEKKNLWARSADPKERAKAYGAHEKAAETREVKTTNVVRQSAWDKLTHKPGEMKRR